MTQAVRAIYESGRLRVLDPVRLAEGEQVEILIRTDQERVRAALGDLLMAPEEGTIRAADDANVLAEIDVAFQGRVSVSDVIIQERQAGP